MGSNTIKHAETMKIGVHDVFFSVGVADAAVVQFIAHNADRIQCSNLKMHPETSFV